LTATIFSRMEFDDRVDRKIRKNDKK
jgi:hypothetical protein